MKKMKILLTFFLATYLSYAQTPDIAILEVASGFDNPVDIQNADDDRLFIVEQSGAIQIINSDDTVNSTPFITIPVNNNGFEQGLLGLAFHPEYATNGFFYVHYTRSNGDTQISRYTVTSDPDIADPNSEFPLLQVDQPFSNHNGGGLAFGEDGFLYIALGDGGSGGDPGNRAQNPGLLLGKMLRIDVDNQDANLNYAIPATNPFVGDTSFRPEIWDLGLRNPFRFSFDEETGAMWIGDVGQNQIEEVDRGIGGGHNYGWRCYEGNSPFNTAGCPDDSELTFPVAQYFHSGNGPAKCSIVGGYVYRGAQFPTMQGLYFFADNCSNEIAFIDATTPADITYSEQFNGNSFVTFGEDINKELYISGLAGTVFRVVDADLLNTDDFLTTNIRIYPNPTTDVLTIQRTHLTSADTVHIFDITGKLVKSQSVQDSITTFSISDVTSGIYLIQFERSGFTQKLIIK